MSRRVKHIPIKKHWFSGHVNEKHLAKVIARAERDGWEYEALENHGWAFGNKWVARFSKQKE